MQAQAGSPIDDLGRNGGFNDATFYKWRAKYGGKDVSDARRLHELKGRNAKLKKLLARGGPRSVGGRRLTPQKVVISGVLDPLAASRKSLLRDSERSKFGWSFWNPSAAQTPSHPRLRRVHC